MGLVVILHLIACIVLILVVLLQRGKGAEMGAAFGGTTQTIFGSTGPAGFLSRLTAVFAIVFMITCLTLGYLSTHRKSTVISKTSEVRPAKPETNQKGKVDKP